MEIIPVTVEEFADLYNAMRNLRQHFSHSMLIAYSGTHSAIGEITIISDPLQCLLLIPNVAQIENDAVLSYAA